MSNSASATVLETPLNETEIALIEAAQRGDAEAFGLLTEEYKQRSFYVARALVHNADDAEDLVQDAFIKAFKAINSFKLDSPFFPWLYKIIKNHCLNFLKKNQRQKTDSMQEMEEETFSQFEDGRESAFDGMVRNETNAYIWEAIDSLSQNFREIIILKHFHNLSYKEMAEALNVPIGTVMSRLFNARQALKEMLEGKI